MANRYRDLGLYFADAFANQEAAAQEETRYQQRGMAEDRYTAQFDQLSAQGPVPPRTGHYGGEDVGENHTGTFPLNIKEDLINRAKNKRRASNGSVELLAGGGVFQRGPKEQREDF